MSTRSILPRQVWIMLAILLILIAAASSGSINELRVRRRCLAAGYPDYRAHLFFMPSYCVKRVNQTDTVVPLSKVTPTP